MANTTEITPAGIGLLTVREVADALRVSTMTVHRLIDAGDLHAHRIGRSVRIPAESVAELLAK